jgi:hypothetical protein
MLLVCQAGSKGGTPLGRDVKGGTPLRKGPGKRFPGLKGSKGATLLWAGIRKGGESLRGVVGQPAR